MGGAGAVVGVWGGKRGRAADVPAEEVEHEYGLTLVESLEAVGTVDAVILAVPHRDFAAFTPQRLAALCSNGNGYGVVIDVKNMFDRSAVEAQNLIYWSL